MSSWRAAYALPSSIQPDAVGRAVAEPIRTGRYGEVDPSPLARDRFVDPARWVSEDLHVEIGA